MAPLRTMAVLGQAGAGKSNLVGKILFMLGIDMNMLQQLESRAGGTCNYVDVVTYFEENNLTKSFYAPSGAVSINGNDTKNDTATADIVVWVVNGASDDRGVSSSSELQSLIQKGALNPKEQLLIVAVSQMDAVGWDEGMFWEVVGNFLLDMETAITVVPVSAWRGDNIMGPPEQVSWVKKVETLMKVIG